MRDATPSGVLLGSAVLFVVLWELRSALGLLARIDINGTAYFIGSLLVVGVTAFGLSVGLFRLSATLLKQRT
jgi:hypothetical protein